MKKITFLLMLLSMFIISCSSDGSGGHDSGAAEEDVEEGFDELTDILNSNNPDFSEALALFESAVGNDPDNTDAQFGLAIIRIASIMNDDQINELLNSLEDTDLGKAVSSGNFMLSIDEVLNFINTIDLQELISNLNFSSSFSLGKNDAEELSDLISLIENIIDDVFITTLTQALDGFDILLDSDNFKFKITGEMQGDNDQETIVLKEAEILALKIGVHSFRAFLYVCSTYNLDPEADDDSLSDLAEVLSQNSNFLKIRSGSNSNMSKAHTDLNEIVEALEKIEDASKGDYFDKIKNKDINEINDFAAIMHNYINDVRTIEIEDEGSEFEIDISGFMNDPPSNLKDILPSYSIYLSGGELCWEWNQNSANSWLNNFDFTFGGLFPFLTSNGLSIDNDDIDWEKYGCFDE